MTPPKAAARKPKKKGPPKKVYITGSSENRALWASTDAADFGVSGAEEWQAEYRLVPPRAKRGRAGR